jgi:hypothetical protein
MALIKNIRSVSSLTPFMNASTRLIISYIVSMVWIETDVVMSSQKSEHGNHESSSSSIALGVVQYQGLYTILLLL